MQIGVRFNIQPTPGWEKLAALVDIGRRFGRFGHDYGPVEYIFELHVCSGDFTDLDG